MAGVWFSRAKIFDTLRALIAPVDQEGPDGGTTQTDPQVLLPSAESSETQEYEETAFLEPSEIPGLEGWLV